MVDLIKTIKGEVLTLKDFSPKVRIQQIVQYLKQLNYKEENAVKLYAFGRFLKELGSSIEEVAEPETLKHLTDKEINMNVGDINVSYREYYDKVYPKDEQLERYEVLEADINKQLKEIKDSIKNRKKQLEQEKKVQEILRKKSVSARL